MYIRAACQHRVLHGLFAVAAGQAAQARRLKQRHQRAIVEIFRGHTLAHHLSLIHIFWEGMAVLRSTGASEWGLGGGVLGAVFGWTLLLLCGRPGANILIVIFMLMGLMPVSYTHLDVYKRQGLLRATSYLVFFQMGWLWRM